jgi:hypothetical protein
MKNKKQVLKKFFFHIHILWGYMCMEEKIFNVGYTSYLEKKKDKKWTTIIKEKILKHKIVTLSIVVIILSMSMNLILIYDFMSVMEKL